MKVNTSSFYVYIFIFFCSFVISECSVNKATDGTYTTLAHEGAQILAWDEIKWPSEAQRDTKEPPRVTFPEIDKTSEKRHVVKRHVQEVESDIKCSEVQAPDGPGIHKIRDIKHYGHSFYFQPKGNFQRLIFQMIIDNMYNVNVPYISDEEIVYNKQDFQNNLDNAWIEVQAEYFKHEVHAGRDKLALRVTVGNESRLLISSRWWRTHSYEGFQVSVEGGASFLFDCVSSTAVLPSAVSTLNKPLLLGGILGSCFLLVIGGWVWYLIIRHHPRQSRRDDQPPSVPPLPASLLLGSSKVNKCPDPEHIYEEFDEETLARLRQKMNPETLGKCGDAMGVKSEPQDYDVPLRTRLFRVPASAEGGMASGFGIDPVYLNEINMSLLEEKMKASCRTSLPESHYVEMHGIINKSSKDFEQ